MGDVVKFPVNSIEINGKIIPKPNSRFDYQMILREFLTQEDYEEVLVCIMDKDYYKELEDEQLKNIVNEYFSFSM